MIILTVLVILLCSIFRNTSALYIKTNNSSLASECYVIVQQDKQRGIVTVEYVTTSCKPKCANEELKQ